MYSLSGFYWNYGAHEFFSEDPERLSRRWEVTLNIKLHCDLFYSWSPTVKMPREQIHYENVKLKNQKLVKNTQPKTQ